MRWYDNYPKLAGYLDSFKKMDSEFRDKIVHGILSILTKENPTLTSVGFALDFPLELQRRRWYDRDPYLWLAMNAMSQANPKILKKVESYLEKEIPNPPGA